MMIKNILTSCSSSEFTSLGLEFLGKSSYNPAAPDRIYFTIGEVIAFLALIIAVYQLLSTRVKFRLNNARINTILIFKYIFPVFIFFVFLASLLPFIPGKAIPLISYPFFWELLSGLGIAICFLYIINAAITPSKINSHNFKKYFNGCKSIIIRGNESELGELAEEIFYSLDNVIQTSSEYNLFEYQKSKTENKRYSISDYATSTLTLLDLWSDERFSKVIVCNTPETAIEFFKQIQNHQFYNSGGYALVQQLVSQSYKNRASILYKENDFQGLGHFKSFSQNVFGNIRLVESFFRPLQAWNHWADEIEPWKIKKYFETINLYLETLFYKTEDYCSSALFSAFIYIDGITTGECIMLNNIKNSDGFHSKHYKGLSEIENGLKNILGTLFKYMNILPAKPDVIIDGNNDSKNCPLIYDIFSKAIFEYFKNLSTIRDDDKARFLAISIWLKIYTVSYEEDNKITNEIRSRLSVLLLKKVKENLINFYYPQLTRLLISIMSLYKKKEDSPFNTFQAEFFNLLIKHYNETFVTDESFANDIIPDNTWYEHENGQLKQKIRDRGNTYILQLNLPAE